MSALPNIAGSPSKIYIGLFGATSTLVPITSIRTGVCQPVVNCATEFVNGLNIYVQTGNQKLAWQLSYYTDSQIPFLISRGLDPSSSDLNATPDPNIQYTIFLLNTQGGLCWLFDGVSPEIDLGPNYDKENPTVITNKFHAESPDLSVNIVQWGTAAEIAAILGARSPI